MNRAHKLIWNLLLFLLILMTYKSSLLLGVSSNLKGAYTQETMGNFTFERYLNGKSQEKMDRLSQQNFYKHDWWVKAHNEWDYQVWDHLNVFNVVEGEDGYLFEQSFIDNLYGRYRLAQMERLEEKKQNIIFVDSLLSSKNKKLVVLLMPSKSFLFPEKIKNFQKDYVPETHVHDEFLKFAKAHELEVINYLDYFTNTTLPYPSFPKQGIHLSEYAESVVLDSILSFMESDTGKDLYDYEFSELQVSEVPRGRDNDIGAVVNLFDSIPMSEEFAYRDFKLNRRDTLNTPNVLVIGDSFYWGIYPEIANFYLLGNHEFWYRNYKIYSMDIETHSKSTPDKCLASIETFDYIFLMVNNTEVDHIGWGYFENIRNMHAQ